MSTKPIKRNENIVPLSKDHHLGLLFCWKIRQGLNARVDLNRIRKYVQYFWQFHLEEHFNEEESLLFNPVQHKLCEEALAQHAAIKNTITTLTADTAADETLYASLATMVDDHIRFEERILFPFLESALPAEKLATIGTVLKEMHATPKPDDYPEWQIASFF